MYSEEVVLKALDRITAKYPDIDNILLNDINDIFNQVLYEYDINIKCTDLVVISDIQDKIVLYLASKKIEGLSMKTLYNYKLHLVRFSNMIRKNIVDINSMDIRIYLAAIAKETGMKNTSLSAEISILKSFFNWLETEDYINKSPLRKIKQTKTPYNLRNALTVEELERLRDACQTERQRALLEFMFSSGTRLNEVVNVNINDICWSTYSLKVIGKGSKEREVYLSPKAKLYIEKYLNKRNDNCPALFVTERKPFRRLGNRAIQAEIKNIAAAAGFDKSIHPHILRHTFATLGLRSGASLTTIQKLLGHTDPATTQIYSKFSQEVIQEEYKKHFIQ